MIKLFDVDNKRIIPTEHCYAIEWLKKIIDVFGEDNAPKVYAYIFYMSYTGDINPYNNFSDSEKEVYIPKDLGIDFSLDEKCVIKAIEKTKELYTTPAKEAYEAMKLGMKEVTSYIKKCKITDGRDGNLDGFIKMMSSYPKLKQAFNEAYKEMKEEEENINVRGDQDLAYDQE